MRFLLLLSLSLLAFGCSKENKPCPDDKNCGDGLSCEKYSETCKKLCAKPSDCGEGKTCDPRSNVCLTIGEIKCKKKCRSKGGCELISGKCKPTKDMHCALSGSCLSVGLCSLVDGECKPTEDEHCSKSDFCSRMGFCSVFEGDCRPTKEKHCKESQFCSQFGECSFDEYKKLCKKPDNLDWLLQK